jgi:hypothetical protein
MKSPIFSLSYLFIVIACVAFFTTGCASGPEAIDEGYMPELSFEHISPLSLSVAAVNIHNNYNSGFDSNDVSVSFPTPPDIVVRRYAEHRLFATSSEGALNFSIEDASVRHTYIEPKSMIGKWTRISGKDRYDVSVRIRLSQELSDGTELKHSVLTMENYLIVPESISISGRELKQLEFLEMLMKDVDAAVVKSLSDNFGIVAGENEADLSTPELR